MNNNTYTYVHISKFQKQNLNNYVHIKKFKNKLKQIKVLLKTLLLLFKLHMVINLFHCLQRSLHVGVLGSNSFIRRYFFNIVFAIG